MYFSLFFVCVVYIINVWLSLLHSSTVTVSKIMIDTGLLTAHEIRGGALSEIEIKCADMLKWPLNVSVWHFGGPLTNWRTFTQQLIINLFPFSPNWCVMLHHPAVSAVSLLWMTRTFPWRSVWIPPACVLLIVNWCCDIFAPLPETIYWHIVPETIIPVSSKPEMSI